MNASTMPGARSACPGRARLRAVLALAMAVATAHVCAATPASPSRASPSPDVAFDAAGAWAQFFAHGTFEPAYAAYEVLPKVGYTPEGVEAAKCAANAGAVKQALVDAPVSIALHRVAMLCAQATGEDAAAEREFQAIASLATMALRGVSESRNAAPIRVLRYDDIFALLKVAGLEVRYKWYERTHMQRGFPLVVAAWDPERKVERHLRFDWIDAGQRIARLPESQFPVHRSQLADGGLAGDAKFNEVAAIDALAVRDMQQVDGYPAKAEKLRAGVEAGGVQSASWWIFLCSEAGTPVDCADRLPGALLPLAEKKGARPMMLLAYVYGNGLGVRRDESVAMQLLDAADRRWSRLGASVEYVRLWQDTHGEAPLPDALARRLAKAVAAGNEDARLLALRDRRHRDPKSAYTAEDIALLSLPTQNGQGEGYSALLADAAERKDDIARTRFRQLAADAGDADAQSMIAFDFLYGDDVPHDEAQGVRLLIEAAHGGNAWSARQLAYRAMREGRYADAERWLLDPVAAYDADALFALAGLYEDNVPGVNGNAARAVKIYRSLADALPEARRRLARMLASGTGTDKDPGQARRLWLRDAEQGDHASEAQLGLALLRGDLGPADEAEGRKWVQRAIAGGEKTASSDYGFWLFYRKGTAASRQEGLAVWRRGLAAGDDGVANNLAWALCTSEHADARDPKAGLDVVKAMDPDMGMAEIDTVAACHAANGDFEKAQAMQRDVVAEYEKFRTAQAAARAGADASVDAQMQEFRDRLALYATGKTYVEVGSGDIRTNE